VSPPEQPSEFDAFAVASMTRLRRLAYAWCRDQDRADDLVQGALERVFAAWPRVRRSEDPFAYTRTTMIRLLISEQRRPRFRREISSDDLPELAAAEADVAGRLDLIALVHRLPRRQRLVILLRFVEDLSVTEVASLMSCSEGTVKSQTNAAMTTLRQWCSPQTTTGAPR
jgi:RNA polymerase sigma-70 factor (sigma-E family)